jgi:hypothetical protein
MVGAAKELEPRRVSEKRKPTVTIGYRTTFGGYRGVLHFQDFGLSLCHEEVECPHKHRTTVFALACATRILKRIKKDLETWVPV